MPKHQKFGDQARKSHITNFFRIRFGLVGMAVLMLVSIVFSLLYLTDLHEDEHNFIVDKLGKQRLYSQRITLQSNRLSSILEALDTDQRIQPTFTLLEKITVIKADMIETIGLFEATLSDIKRGSFDFNSKRIELFDAGSREAAENMAAMEREWRNFKGAADTILESKSKDTEFRQALIRINENSDVILGLSHDFSVMALDNFARRHRQAQLSYTILISTLIILCVWLLFGAYRYIIEPYRVFYRGLKELGSPQERARERPASRKSPLMVEVEQTFAVMRDMVDLLGVINQGASFNDTLHLIFNTFRLQIPYNYIGIATFVGYRSDMLQASFGESDGSFPGLPARLTDKTVDIETTSLKRIIESGQPRVINDLEAYAKRHPIQDYTRILLEEGIKSSITLALSINGKQLGFLFFSSKEKNVYTDRHVDFLRNIRNAIALSFEKNIFIDELVYSSTLALAKMAEAKDEDTADHLDRMCEYSVLLARCMKNAKVYGESLTPEFLHSLERFSPMHDIGKVGIRDDVLKKPGKLDDDEMTHMRTHAEYGAAVLREAENNIAQSGRTFFGMGITIAASHHERWDGSGYPAKLAGEDIPLEARIVSVADVLDALTTRRPYKKPFPFDQSVKMILDGRGTQFDPAIIEVFERSIPKFRAMYDAFVVQMPEIY